MSSFGIAYNHHCQVCDETLITPTGYYSEGAHIIPLGSPHNGPDVESNILCLCPNHHLLFDRFAFSISSDGSLVGLTGGNIIKSKMHTISKRSCEWHNQMYTDSRKSV